MIQGTPEWHVWRSLGLGGSDAPIVMGASPWKTALQLWHEKTSGKSVDISHLKHVQRGHDLEDKGRAFAEDLLGDTFLPTCLVHKKHPEIRASFDGLNLDHTSAIEIKCPGRPDHQKACDGQIPEKYIWQLRHLMMVAETDQIHYVSFDGKNGVMLRLLRCEKEEKKLLKAELEFWKGVISKTPPDYTDRDFVPIATPQWQTTAQKYCQTAREIKALEEMRDELKKQLLELADGHARVRGHGLQLSQTTRVGNVDYKRVPELKGVDLEPYRKAGTTLVTIRELDAESDLS